MNRRLHPGAWWLWALALATAAALTTNPWLLGMVIGVAGCVVVSCRTDDPWAKSYGVFLRFGLIVIAIRVFFYMIFGGVGGTTVLLDLPRIPLPSWANGIALGGPVTAEGIVAALYDGLALATLLCCVGAANALANTKRLLRAAPGAIYEVSVAVVVALSVAPQLVTSGQAAYRARALRGERRRGVRLLRSILVPVVVAALDRSLALAAAMESRGYGRVALSRRRRRAASALLLTALLLLGVGCYTLISTRLTLQWSVSLLALGGLAGGVGVRLTTRRLSRSRYRPDRWGWRESTVVGSGVAAASAVVGSSMAGVGALVPAAVPLQLPGVPLLAAGGVLLALLPAWVAP